MIQFDHCEICYFLWLFLIILGSGKTIASELAMFRVFNSVEGNKKCVYIAPLKALVRERMTDWKVRLEKNLGKKVVELTGDTVPDMKMVAEADVIVTTPEKWGK